MDPPTATARSNAIDTHHDKTIPPNAKSSQQLKRSIPETAAGEENALRQLYHAPAEFAHARQQSPPLGRSHTRNAAKIIKGEIHNVLTVMRSDPRYYSTGEGTGGKARPGKRVQSRFEYEERQQTIGRGRSRAGANHDVDWKTSGAGAGTISSHPILQGLRDLHDILSIVEVEANSTSASGSISHSKSQMNVVTFVAPFSAAVRSSDVDAKTTGEALSALHKFIVYGFVGGLDGEYDPHVFSSSSDKIRESISAVARCIRHCSFDDRTPSKTSTTPRAMFSFWSGSNEILQQGANPILGQNDDAARRSARELPSFLTRPRRAEKSTGKGPAPNAVGSAYSALSPSDEGVILKLLSLSVQVLRCPAGRNHLPAEDVVGIFDTCLYVAIAAGEARRSRHLLRSAAADALSHCIIVVFGMCGRSPRKRIGPPRQGERRGGDDAENPTSGDASDSDDDWGERDPTEGLAREDALLVRRGATKPHSTIETEPGSEFGDEPATPESNAEGKVAGNALPEEEPALVAIMHRLATLADPLLHEDDTCVLALSLVNIALETMSDADDLSARYPRLLSIMQNDLCRNLLRLSTSADLTILGLALRVIFNLFDTIKDHLKVQLEVFLTSVHLRILSFSTALKSKDRVWSSSPERRELALESLLEFCREPSLMADLYLNYDCDINCTNLFETIVHTLAKVANPEDEGLAQTGEPEPEDDSIDKGQVKPTRLNILNRLALEGVLAVIDGIARRCRACSKYVGKLPDSAALSQKEDNVILQSPPDSGNSAFLGSTLYINTNATMEGSASVNESDYDFCTLSTYSAASKLDRKIAPERCDSEMSENDIEWLTKARYHTSLALRERKLRKMRMAKAAAAFNERSKDKEWIEEAERLGVLPSPATPSSVASFLYSTPKLDKAKIGLYLSKGPRDKYPFHGEVLGKFSALFEFGGMSFSEALRTFLGRFRLPGEAQCIDRLMEAFATRLYEVQLSGTASVNNDQMVERSMLDPPRRVSDAELSERSGMLDPPAASEEVDLVFPFKSSDAAFILSFSTIMLNTDLHNPNMQDEKRMTLEQFIRNNRGINDGKDLPVEFLKDLYYEIKNEEIQVKQDLLQDGVGSADAFDGLLAKANDATTPFFTSNHSAGVHERDMYVSVSSVVIDAISNVFVETWDDVLVTKALLGLRHSALICSYFGLNEQFNNILDILLGFGVDYVGSVASLMFTAQVDGELSVKSLHGKSAECVDAVSDLEAELVSRDIPRLPKSFFSALNSDQDAWDQSPHFEIGDMDGSAAHRGLLSLQYGLTLSKHHLSLVSEAWPMLLDVMFSLRDVSALPPRLSDLDDFADSCGNPLPASVFANRSQQRVDQFMHSMSSSDKPDKEGFFAALFGFGQASAGEGSYLGDSQKQFPLSETLQQVAQCAQLDKIIMKHSDVALAKRILSAMLRCMFPDEYDEDIALDPLFEHNSVFVLELAARLLISNRAHSRELYPIFLTKFQQLISPLSFDPDSSSTGIVLLKFPYILERIVVTILRACIHLFDVPETGLRDQLNQTLNLIATLPSSYTHAISDRIGCGAAIILRGCFYLFDDSSDDWSTIKRLLDLAAQDKSGRGFVFDGIACVIDSIDYAIPSAEDGDEMQSTNHNGNELQLSQCGVEVMASLLLKFMDGSYEDDLDFKVPSMMYLQKVYSFSKHFADRGLAGNRSAACNGNLQGNEFETVVTAIYNDACLSQDCVTAKRGFESLQGIFLSTRVDWLPGPKWFAFLRLVATKPPSITSQEARMSSLSLIGRLTLTLMPELSNQKENWSELEDWTIRVASLVSENLKAGRSSPLFETTVQTVTNVVNVMSMTGFNEGEGVNFCAWVGETLLYELEKVGASGGATSMIVRARCNNAN